VKIEVDTDAHGIKAESLRQILENWPEGKTKPKALYTVPVSISTLSAHLWLVLT
jgi:DNA-binding transcriptional MocR family regulator